MSFVKYEQKDQVAVLTIDRPEALNALNTQVLCDLCLLYTSRCV